MSASLFDLLDNPEEFLKELENLDLEGTIGEFIKTCKNGVCGSQFDVEVEGKREGEGRPHHPHGHPHRHPHNMECFHRPPLCIEIENLGGLHFHLHLDLNEEPKKSQKRHHKKHGRHHEHHGKGRRSRRSRVRSAKRKRHSAAADVTNIHVKPHKN